MGPGAVSSDGYIAFEDDTIGPLLDWLGNGDTEWTWTEGHEDTLRTSSASGTHTGGVPADRRSRDRPAPVRPDRRVGRRAGRR
jgi:hypothetical protein